MAKRRTSGRSYERAAQAPTGATARLQQRGHTRARPRSGAPRFARAGYASTTNKQIADEAGLTAPAIYQYFDSKAELYMATVRDANEALIAEYRRALLGVRGVRSGLRTVLLASAEVRRRDPSLSAFLSAVPVEMQRHEELGFAMREAPSEIVASSTRSWRRGCVTARCRRRCTSGWSRRSSPARSGSRSTARPSTGRRCRRSPRRWARSSTARCFQREHAAPKRAAPSSPGARVEQHGVAIVAAAAKPRISRDRGLEKTGADAPLVAHTTNNVMFPLIFSGRSPSSRRHRPC